MPDQEFSFRSMLKPGQAMEMAIRRELERRRSLWTPRPGYVYRGAGDFLLQHGTFFKGAPVPPEFAHLQGELGFCFLNSVEAAAREPRLRYFEGVYSVAGTFTPHAWCVDNQDRLVDLTWKAEFEGAGDLEHRPIMAPDHWGYFGCEFNVEYIEEHHAVNGWGLFDRPATDQIAERITGNTGKYSDDPDDEWPTLMVPYDPQRRSLP